MKRILLIILINLIIFGLIYTTYRYSERIEIGTASEKDDALYGKEYSKVDVTILMEEDMDTERIFNEIQQGLSVLPIEVVRSFADDGYKVMVVSNVEDENLFSYTDKLTKTVQIRNMAAENAVKVAFLYEMCRYIDGYLSNISGSGEFMVLYNKCGGIYDEYESEISKNIKNGNTKMKNDEFFAISLKDYLYHGSYLEEKYPYIYEYYKSVITN